MREASVRHRLVGVDRPVAEVADEQVAAEAPEVGRRQRKPPRRVQPAALGHAGEQRAVRVVLVDEAEALAVSSSQHSADCFA